MKACGTNNGQSFFIDFCDFRQNKKNRSHKRKRFFQNTYFTNLSIRNKRRLLALFVFLDNDKIDKAKNYSEYCSGRSSHTDIGEACVRSSAHEVRHRKSDDKALCKALKHNENALASAVEVAHKAEKKACDNSLGSKAS